LGLTKGRVVKLKIGFLITARLKSTRLPLKILKDLNGQTVVERVIARAKQVKGNLEIVLCTSANPQDRPLVDLAAKNGIYYFTGDEIDVLQRLLAAATFYDIDSFVSITADNPLFAIDYANLVVDRLRSSQCDYVEIAGLPLGAAVTGVKTNALKVVCQIKKMIDTEIWGQLLNQPDVFAVATIKVPPTGVISPGLRLTLDYPEDYRLLNHLYSQLDFHAVLNLENVCEYLTHHPEIATLNRHCVQFDLDAAQINAINAFFAQNRAEILALKHQIYHGP
jgi:spore coat polysaccharide biosynthesis protein SpsF